MSGSDSGSEDLPLGAQGDLASRTLVLESKRFYLDVKENKRGRFIKIAEISADGRKETIILNNLKPFFSLIKELANDSN